MYPYIQQMQSGSVMPECNRIMQRETETAAL